MQQEIISILRDEEERKTFLVKEGEEKSIKKIIKKDNIDFDRIKNQFYDLQRLYGINNNMVPMPIEQQESETEYYYRTSYLDDYKSINKLSNQEFRIGLKIGLIKLQEIYSVSKNGDREFMFNKNIQNANYKIQIYSTKSQRFSNLIFSKKVIINRKQNLGLINALSKIKSGFFAYNHIGQIHGNLTLENILFNGRDTKFINPSCAEFYEAPEKDLGKLCEFILCKRHEWPAIEELIVSDVECHEIQPDFSYLDNIADTWANILKRDKSDVQSIAIFYMCLSLIESVPELARCDKDHAYYAILMAVIWLNKII